MLFQFRLLTAGIISFSSALFTAYLRTAFAVRRPAAGPRGRLPREKRSAASFLNRASHGSSRRPVRAALLRAKAFRKAHIKKTWFPPFILTELWRFSLFSEKCGCGVCFAFTFALRFTTSPVIAQICVHFFICIRRAMPPSPEERARSVRVFRCVRLKTLTSDPLAAPFVAGTTLFSNAVNPRLQFRIPNSEFRIKKSAPFRLAKRGTLFFSSLSPRRFSSSRQC